MSKGFVVLTTLIVLISTARSSSAAEIFEIPWNASPDNSTIGIIGEIKTGDAERFQEVLRKLSPETAVYLSSPGGDLVEAVKIGRIIRSSFLATQAPAPEVCVQMQAPKNKFTWWPKEEPTSTACACNSACFVIWAAGVKRTGGSNNYVRKITRGDSLLGIHRPRFESSYFSGLSAEDADVRYDELLMALFSYLDEMDVQRSISDEMLAVPSNEIRVLSDNEREALSGYIPAVDEWMLSKCGGLTQAEFHEFFELRNRKWDSEANRKDAVGLSNAEEYYFQHLDKRQGERWDCEYDTMVEEQTKRLRRD